MRAYSNTERRAFYELKFVNPLTDSEFRGRGCVADEVNSLNGNRQTSAGCCDPPVRYRFSRADRSDLCAQGREIRLLERLLLQKQLFAPFNEGSEALLAQLAALASLTKGGLNAATKSLAIEYAKRGIRVNAVARWAS